MSQIADRYRRLSQRFADLVRDVPADAWDNPSPCEGWTARDVVHHVVEAHGIFEGLAGRPIDPLPDAGADPLAAFEAVRTIVQADLEDPDRATVAWDGVFGRTTFESGVDRFLSFDLVVHGWDLAKATDGDTSLPREELDTMEAAIASWGDAARAPGVLGPPLDVPEDADRETRLLAQLGRAA